MNVRKFVLTMATAVVVAGVEGATGELLHRWSFNGSYGDSAGGATATPVGSVSWTGDNTAVKLPGGTRGTGWIDLGANAMPGDGAPITLEIWATLDAIQSWGRVFDFGSSTQNYICQGWNVMSNDKTCRIDVCKNGAILARRENVLFFEVGVKYHLTATFLPHGDGSTSVRFMRRNASTGALERDCSFDVKGWTPAEWAQDGRAHLYLGHSFFSGDNDAAATYDEVRIWRGVLNDTQLAANVAAGPDTVPQTIDCTPRPTLRIMPLGDSITEGAGSLETSGYRLPLYRKLTELGYAVDYVGENTATSTGDLPDWDHEGHGGWRISHASWGISERILGWMEQCEAPDAVLLLLGTNDTSDGGDYSDRIGRMGALIDKIAGRAPAAHIFLSTILERTDNASNNTKIQTYFNPYVENLVAAHVAKGQRVHFVDLCTSCPAADTLSSDKLHPHADGYVLMAEAWKDALVSVFPAPTGDTEAPKLARVVCLGAGSRLRVSYGKPVADNTIATPSQYTLTGAPGVTVTSATAEGDGRSVNLTLSAPIPVGAEATLSVTDVKDTCASAHVGASSLTFHRAASLDYRDNVPQSEWGAYAHVYTYEIPNSGNVDRSKFEELCSVNRAASTPGTFDRIAYCIELQQSGAELQYAWVSMDAFTDDLQYIGVPVDRKFQQKVANMNVFCNVPGVVNGLGIATGNIEFWPYAYGNNSVAANGLGGSDTAFDYDDKTDGGGGYGSMQIHNWGEKQTIFGYNAWAAGGTHQLGIGTCDTAGAQPDWTFCANAATYSLKRIHVFVRPSADTVAPTVVSATAQASGKQVTVVFSENLAASALTYAQFVSSAFVVKNATLQDDGRTVVLDTTSFVPEGEINLAVSGVRDLAGNVIAADSSVAVASPALPTQLRTDVGAELDDYELVYQIDLPERGNFNASRDAYKIDWSDKTNAFDRVAYYMELKKPNADRQWVWTSCDAFARQRKMLAVPSGNMGIIFQRKVYNTVVKSNIGLAGVYPEGCSVEIWRGSYVPGPGGVIPNAPSSAYAWDDRIYDGNNLNDPVNGGYGSMQFSCYQDSTPLWGVHNFGTDGGVLGLGLGSAKGLISGHENDYDWTFGNNASQFETRRLYVFVRPTRAEDEQEEQEETEVKSRIGAEAFGKFQTLFAIRELPVSCRVNDATWRANNLYSIDHRSKYVSGQISRVGYYMELQKPGEAPVWIWTAMDNFATDPSHLGIPEGGYGYQKVVNHLTVKSNSSAVTEVDDCATGCIEFWATNWAKGNGQSGWGGDGNKYDWNDSGWGTGSGGYGSMQVHNYGASQVLWAVNSFNNGGTPCVGIGTNTTGSGDPDWTFTGNAGSYSVRKLYCFVLLSDANVAEAAERVARAQTEAKVGAAMLADYQLLFASESIPTSCKGRDWEWMNANFYTVDNRAAFAPKGYDRVAYFMELQTSTASESTWVWTAMDPFDDHGVRLGVPYGGYCYKVDVNHLDVRSNCGAITEVTDASGGCVEFWACSYAVGANGVYDWDDKYDGDGTGNNGYGSMQVHNKGLKQVLWSFNCFNQGNQPCIGIGNSPGAHPDWVLNNNANGYAVRRLYCFVRPCTPPTTGDVTGNSIVRATGSTDGDKITVRLANPVSLSELTNACFTLDQGVTVKAVKRIDATHVMLSTTSFAAGTELRLSITGLLDSTGAVIDEPVTGTVSVPTAAEAAVPADIVASVPALAGYRLVQRLEVGELKATDVYRNTPYCVDESYYGGVFDRIAYVLDETPQDGEREWVYASMDAFTGNATQIGLPVYERGAWYQQKVANLDVAGSANANVVTGTGLATGSIEFWPQSYSGNVSMSGIGGSGAFDWNDTPETFGEGHGSMQVHNWGAGETILSFTKFGNAINEMVESGIGNNPNDSGKLDWTLQYRPWSARTLYVLVRDVANPDSDGKGPMIVTEPQGMAVKSHQSAFFFVHAPAAVNYQWYRDGVPITGAVDAELHLDDIRASDDGNYSVVVIDADGNRTRSNSARLRVIGRETLIILR